jgi:hypothetical protein
VCPCPLPLCSAEAETEERPVAVQVRYDGRVFYAPHRVFRSGCLVDLTHYPFDVHTCELWIQSASRYSWDLELRPYPHAPFDLDTYLDSFKEAKVRMQLSVPNGLDLFRTMILGYIDC